MFNARNWITKQFESSPAIEKNAKIVAKWPGKILITLERCRGFQPGVGGGGGVVLVGKFTEEILSTL